MTITTPSNGPRNRLSREASPYLLLHAANPVDWYPWGEEAFARASAEDRPIFLSVGYSTCHWCHVMARECFSDPEIAKQMNEGFVCIKVDREERPDVDEMYMAATQLISREGGWPNSVFLTPDLKPFFAGTYFPPRDTAGRPGFPRILASVREAWALQRVHVVQQAEAVAQAVKAQLQAAGESTAPPTAEVARAALAALAQRFDRRHGGFGRAPKFPSPANLYLLLDLARTGDPEATEMLVSTLDGMARGGIRDHVAGGFHRYSVDAQWLVPHFEKMLYDNATLVELYAEAEALAPGRGFAEVAFSTAEFLLEDLSSPDGAFLTAIDAESGGEEGAFYVWTREELRSALGEDDALLARVWGFDSAPNFEGGRHVLHLPRPVSEVAREAGLDPGILAERMQSGRDRLLAARSTRVAPLVDDKVLTDWNGLAIAGLARAGLVLGVPMLVEAAAAAAAFVLEALIGPDGGLAHSWREGRASVPAFLDDYAFLIRGLLRLYEATEENAFLEEAQRLLAEQETRLADPWGGYYSSGEDARVLVRSRPAHDGASLSGNGVAALNLLDLASMTGQSAFLRRAQGVLAAFGEQVSSMAAVHPTLARAALRLSTSTAPPSGLVAPVFDRVGASASEEVPSLEDLAREVVEVRGVLDPGYDVWRSFRLELSISRGWSITGNAATEGGASVVSVLGSLRNLTYPPGEAWSGKVVITGEVEPPEFGAPSLELRYQPCDDSRCLPAVERLVRLR